MAYRRHKNPTQLTKTQKLDLLRQYFEYYRRVAQDEPAALYVKVPREAFAALLDQIGELLLKSLTVAAGEPGPVREFLQANPVPEVLKGLLPDEFRAFCLGLNALKQWVSAEQAATDRYLLGGTARQSCRQAATSCAVTGQSLDGQTIQLHHPLRDGRPPIPVGKSAHANIERQDPGHDDDPHLAALRALKREGNRSWVQLRLGCRVLLGHPAGGQKASIVANAKTFARKAVKQTGMTYEQLIEWLDAQGF